MLNSQNAQRAGEVASVPGGAAAFHLIDASAGDVPRSDPRAEELSAQAGNLIKQLGVLTGADKATLSTLVPELLKKLDELDGLTTRSYGEVRCRVLLGYNDSAADRESAAAALDAPKLAYARLMGARLTELRKALGALPEDVFNAIVEAAGDEWSYYLETQRARGGVILAAQNGNGRTAGALTLNITIRVGNEDCKLHDAANKLQSPDSQLRQNAWSGIVAASRKYRAPLFSNFSEVVRRWHGQGLSLQDKADPVALRLLLSSASDDFSFELFHALRAMDTRSVWLERLSRKARALGKGQLDYWDMRPALKRIDLTVSEDGLFALHKAALRELFPPRFLETVNSLRDQGRIVWDGFDSPNESGAKCFSFGPALKPLVLLRGLRDLPDTFTQMHENMHACSTVFASERTNNLLYDAPDWLKDVFSNFGEFVQSHYLQRNLPQMAAPLAGNMLTRMFDFSYLGASINNFEEQAHQALIDGAEPGDIDGLYLDELDRCFAGGVRILPSYAPAWRGIPHITTQPFDLVNRMMAMFVASNFYYDWCHAGESKEALECYQDAMSRGLSCSPRETLEISRFDARPEVVFAKYMWVVHSLMEIEERGLLKA